MPPDLGQWVIESFGNHHVKQFVVAGLVQPRLLAVPDRMLRWMPQSAARAINANAMAL
jgi:hypothetical protein